METPAAAEGVVERLPELMTAIDTGVVSFGQLTEAHFGRDASYCADEATRAEYTRLYPSLLKAFGRQWGVIERIGYGQTAPSAVALTNRRRWWWQSPGLHHEIPVSGQPDVLRLLLLCDRLRIGAYKFGDAGQVRRYYEELYVLVHHLLQVVDDRRNSHVKDDAVVAELDRFAKTVEELHDNLVYRAARLIYLRGAMMAGSALVVAGLAATAALATNGYFASGVLSAPLCVLAGALGATLSVMSRLAGGAVSIRRNESNWLLGWFGAFRPVIGGVFGLVLYVLVFSGLIALRVPISDLQQLTFYVGLAFIAGFSERFAPDLIAGVPASLGLGMQHTGPEASQHDEGKPKS